MAQLFNACCVLFLMGCVYDESAPLAPIGQDVQIPNMQSPEPRVLATEQPGDTQPNGSQLQIDYASQGYFHNTSASLYIRGGMQPSARLIQNDTAAQLPLSDVGLSALDNWIAHLRSIEGYGGCTTSETIVLRWLGPEQTVEREESFVDRTCRAGGSDEVSIL